MIIQLNKIQVDYLYNNLLKDRDDLRSKLEVNKMGDYFWFKMNEPIVYEIRDRVNLKLQLKGFDTNYELTKEGEILDDLIDILFE